MGKHKPTIRPYREEELENVIRQIFWMARRYAHGRHTYAPQVVRDAFYVLKANGINIEKDNTIKPPIAEKIKGMTFRKDYLDDIN